MQPIEFMPLSAHSVDYPRPHFTFLPTLALSHWLGQATETPPSAFIVHGQMFMFGRYALVEALRRAGVGLGTVVLLPAFHCRTIVDSVVHLGAEPRFYPVTAKLEPIIDCLSDLAATCDVRALLLTHYFGFANAPVEAEAFCCARGIALIEDCAHAFYGSHNGRMLGRFGQYATASAWKFFPVHYGAMLRDNTGGGAMRLAHQPWVKELKGVANLIGKATSRNKMPREIDINAVHARALELGARQLPSLGLEHDPDSFRSDWVRLAAPRAFSWVVSSAAHDFIAERRRANYLLLSEGLRGLEGVTPLFPELPAQIVPYAFPLLADSRGLIFHALKLAGMPIWRWEDMAMPAIADCPVAADYRLRLLQLPCHQGLDDADITWMTTTVAKVAKRFAPTTQ